jgi:hypothetical protein
MVIVWEQWDSFNGDRLVRPCVAWRQVIQQVQFCCIACRQQFMATPSRNTDDPNSNEIVLYKLHTCHQEYLSFSKFPCTCHPFTHLQPFFGHVIPCPASQIHGGCMWINKWLVREL